MRASYQSFPFCPTRLFFACLAALLLLTAARAALPHPALSIGPAPAWIEEPLDPLHSVERPEAAASGLDYLVNERQELVSGSESFVHFAFRVTDAASLGDAAEFSLGFDPGYERVVIHHLRIIRDGVTEDRLEPDAFEILRQERDRDRAIYDGRLTAIHQMRDVRVGDIVWFAYTTSGANPVFADHYSRTLSLGWDTPCRQFRARIVHPISRPLHHRLRGEQAFAATTRSLPGDLAELRWDLTPLPAINAESGAPDWHVGYPYVQISEHASWAEVAAWALPLYTADAASPELAAKIEELRAVSTDPEERIVAALRFVQEEIRYLAIALGVHSHRPSPPADTLARRFGDCKDKTLLLCTLLRGLGIEADPALVDTYAGRALRDAQPTPLAFDHVIARVVLPDARVIWLDPTRLYQTGPIDQRLSSDFGYTLPLRRDTSGLEHMSRAGLAPDRLHETITFNSHAFDRPVDLEIVSLYTGERATYMRAYLAGTTPERLTQDYLNYYLQKYPGLASTGPAAWTDDLHRNRVRVVERYTVPDFWIPGENGVWTAELYPHAIGALVGSPANQNRRAPLAVGYPDDTHVDIALHPHTSWEVEPLDLTLSDGHLHYVSSVRYTDDVVRLNYQLRHKFDHVPASEVPAYTQTLSRIRDDLALSLTHNPDVAETAFRLNPWTTALCAFFLLGSIWTSWRVLARRPAPGRPPVLPSPVPAAPIGGWLLLVSLGVIVRCFSPWFDMGELLDGFFNLGTWHALVQDASPSRHFALGLLIGLEVAFNSALVILVLLAAALFFMRRREAPAWNIAILGGNAAFLALDLLLAHFAADIVIETNDWRDLTRAFIGAGIWIPYFLVSQRVRETFVN